MKKYRIYIVGALFLIVGFIVGRMIKPASTTNPPETAETHNHGTDDVTGEDEVWTCSMHPQIRQNEPGICPICEMDLTPLNNSLGSDDPTILMMSEAAAKLAQVETFVVGGNQHLSKRTQSSPSINVDGTVELDERTIKTQTAHLAGRIDDMTVTFEGQYINKGQKIATIYSTELLAASQELITAAKFDDRVEGLKDAAIQKLKNWKITPSQINTILSTGKPMETIDIYADQSGYVLSKRASQGDHVMEGQALYTTGSTSRLWLIFNVFESDLSNVAKGSKIAFTTPSVPNHTFQSQITYIDPLLKTKSRTATVRAEIGNTGNKLKPGMLLNGEISVKNKSLASGKSSTQVSIPSTAVLWTGDRSVVYVQLPDTEVPTYQYREVLIANQSGNTTTITEGLSMGDMVVTNGAFAIDAAAQLSNGSSMMNRNVTVKKENQPDVVPSFVDDTPDQFKDQLDKVVAAYLVLKDALVATNSVDSRQAIVSFNDKLTSVDMNLLKGESHIYWMEQLEALEAHGKLIESADDVEKQRKQFDFLSRAMINSLKAFGTNKKTYYVQHCPMAMDNVGADWISTEDQIRNPYFGDKMMKCGIVVLEIN